MDESDTSELRERVAVAFRQQCGREPAVVVRAPGRVNLLGAHVDYNDGWVLPAAIDRAAWLAAAPRADDTVRIHALDFDETQQFVLSNLQSPISARRAATWPDYPAGVAWAMQAAGHQLGGMDAVLAGDVPIGAGVSSSAAVEMAFATAWEALAGLDLTGVEKAQVGRRAENGFLGVQSGIMDQFASVHGAENHLILLDCRTLEHELIPLPAGTALLVADTRIRRELANSEYNVRRRQCEAAVNVLSAHLPGIRALRDVSPADFERYAHRLPIALRRRAQHVVEECRRVREGAAALQGGDLARFGALVRQSHASSRDLYEVSILELDVLAATAWGTDGVIGARLTGAGFGGCVAALVAADRAQAVAARLRGAYQAEFGQEPRVYVTEVAAGAAVV